MYYHPIRFNLLCQVISEKPSLNKALLGYNRAKIIILFNFSYHIICKILFNHIKHISHRFGTYIKSHEKLNILINMYLILYDQN